MGPKAMAVAAEFGQGWVTIGGLPAQGHTTTGTALAAQSRLLDDALSVRGRALGSIERVFLDGFTEERPLASVDAFVDVAGRFDELGITELVVHWPIPDSQFDCDPGLFERIATDGVAQLGG
jgi:hypothetical protein